MNLKILTWNSHPINDDNDYVAKIPIESKATLSLQPVSADRAENYPALSGGVLTAPSFSFQITIKHDDPASIDALREQLKGWFSPLDFQFHNLIAEDLADTNKKQYQLTGLCAKFNADTGAGAGEVTFLVTIATTEGTWKAVTADTDTWNITASGQQRTLTALGNTFSLPKIAIKPTTARTGQFQYNRWVQFYNPIATPLTNYSVDLTNGGLNTSALVNFTGVSNQINQVGGITAVATTIPIDTAVGGGLPTVGMGYVGTEQISWTGNTGTSLTGVTRGIGGTIAAIHADNAVIALSKMLADGSDIAVQFDGQLINRWITGANGASTKIWVAQNWQRGQSATLRTALPNNGTAVTVVFGLDATSYNCLVALKTARNSVFVIGTEAFTFSPGNVDLVNRQITSCSRAQKDTSFAAHSAAAAINWIEHDIRVCYGNSAGSPLVVDDTQKPLLDLTNSTNTSWVQTQFFDTGSTRPAQWVGQVISSVGKQSSIYTADQDTFANPATELGSRLLNYQIASIWKAETGVVAWTFYHPAGITTVSMSGKKFLLTGTTWPTIAGLQKSSNGGNTWLTVWTEAIPALNTWTAFAHAAQSLSGTYNNIRIALADTIGANPSGTNANEADIQGDTVTLTLDSSKTPSVTLGGENNIYYLNAKITNTTTGDYIIITYTMALNRTITIDCEKKTVTYDDGSNAISALQISSTRNNWLALQSGDNILQYDDTGIANVQVVTTWQDKNL